MVSESAEVDPSNTEKALVLVGVNPDALSGHNESWEIGWLPVDTGVRRLTHYWAWTENPVFVLESSIIGPIEFEGTHFKLLAVKPGDYELVSLDAHFLGLSEVTLPPKNAFPFTALAKQTVYIGTYRLEKGKDECLYPVSIKLESDKARRFLGVAFPGVQLPVRDENVPFADLKTLGRCYNNAL